MRLFAGLDVSDATTSICLVDASSEVVAEFETQTSSTAIAKALRPYRRRLTKVGQEAGNISNWLHKELLKLGFPAICMDARHAHSLLRLRLNKTDANDAHGLAVLLAKGMYTSVHVKSDDAVQIRAFLALREALVARTTSLKLSLSSTLKTAKGAIAAGRQAGSSSTESMNALNQAIESLERGIAALQSERAELETTVKHLAKDHEVCRRLMAIPGVGPVTALTFLAAVDDPFRFQSSRLVPAYFGLTPRVFQSGETTVTGRISRKGDFGARKALYIAARSLLIVSRRDCKLRRWGLKIAEKRGHRIASVACARKLAVVMHRLWITGEEFDPAR